MSKEIDVYTGKLIGLGSYGAADMTGIHAGLRALMCQQYGEYIINIYCFSHRLELAF